MSIEKKMNIFYTAVRLFSEKSYDVVTIRELSAAANVKDATLYHYFKSKEGILHEIITAFKKRIASYIPTEKQIDRYVDTDTPEQLLMRFVPNFKDEEIILMSQLHRIVFMEQFTMDYAKDVVTKEFYGKTAKNFQYALDRLIELEKIPFINTRLFSLLWADTMFARAIMYASNFSVNSTGKYANVFSDIGIYLINSVVNGDFKPECLGSSA